MTSTTLSVDVRGLIASGAFAAGYNVYVAASVPTDEATILYQLPANSVWSQLVAPPIAAFLNGAALDSQTAKVNVIILQQTDISELLGATVYLGYGTSSDEMLASGRYSVILTIQ